jgi:hypothetical protein
MAARTHCGAPEHYLSRTPALQGLLHPVPRVLLPIPERQTQTPLPPPLLPLRRRLLVMDSHSQLPTAFTDPLISFPDLCSSSPAPSRPPILAGAWLPMITIRRRLLLTVDRLPRPTPHHDNLSANSLVTP